MTPSDDPRSSAIGAAPAADPVALRGRIVGRHRLSRTQELIWASQRRHHDVPLANMGDRIRIRGPLDPDRFVAAFDAVVTHVDLLRMVITDDPEPAAILARPPAPTTVIDLDPGALDDWSASRIATPIDAATCVYDSVLIRHADDDWTWWIDVHHVAIDAWAAARLVDATAHAYAHPGHPAEADLDAVVESDFFGHVAATRDHGDAVAGRRAAWADEAASTAAGGPLAPYGTRGSRTTDSERLPVPRGEWDDALAAALGDEYRSFSRELSVLAIASMALAVLMHRLDGRTGLVVGVPVHHRSRQPAGRIVGPLMELYPLTVHVDPDETHREMFARTLRSIMALLRRARPGESPDTPFEVVVNVTTATYGDFAGMPAAREWMRSGHVEPNHPIRVQVFDRYDPDAAAGAAHSLDWELDLNPGLSIDGSHRRLPAQLAAVLGAIVTAPHEPVGRVPIVDDDDRRALARLNPDPAPRRHATPVHQRIREALRADPDRVVAEHDGDMLRAGPFDTEADRVAGWLVASGLAPGDPVGLRMPRGLDVLVAVQAVLRAGGRFVFLDPADPAARHETIAADAGLFTILDRLPDRATTDTAWTSDLPAVGLDDGAYVLYTSGSTGEPKGVPISHRGLADYLDFAVETYVGDDEPPWVALHSSLVFDLTITSLFLALLTGGRTVVFAKEPVEALGRIAADERLTLLKATPSQLEILTRLAGSPMRLRTVVVGGEAFRRPVAERLRFACVDGVRIFNEYGPTEAVVGCMIHEYDPARDRGADVPIGAAAPGTQIAILDPLGEITPIGSWGELHVRRPGMAAAYLNRPALSAERFVDLSLRRADAAVLGRADVAGDGPWYRTGDRVRVERPGVAVFGGRHDDQVKVDGIRLEPAEVEAAMVAHPEIDTALARVWSPADAAARRRAALRRCVRCGLGTDVPDVALDADGVCSVCHEFDAVEPQTRRWFRTEEDLAARLASARERAGGDFDCIHLLSGGKDSTYALYQLVERGWRVHAFTLDNGFISEGAKDNIRRSVADLGISHEFATTPVMNEIFNDSLDRYSNVCQGCYKTIYTIALARADELGIPVIVTGLSRGQFFETRLVPHQFESDRFDPEAIDRTVLEARRVYHHTDDAVTRLLPEQRVVEEGDVLDRVEFVDFYRYVDVELADMYEFLEQRAPWVRPADTGRSTNCLINVAGIHVHRSEQGYHNYAEPYSWDVRLGHKTRAEALEELDDDIDPDEVAALLDAVGYEPKTQGVLTAWYRSRHGGDLDPDELRRFLRDRLPDHAVPAAFVRVDEMPLAASAKVDVAALPPPTRFHRRGEDRVAPTGDTERRLVEIWASVLAIDAVGVTDDFFDLGGASLDALEVVAMIDDDFGSDLPDATVFRVRTVRELAEVVDAAVAARDAAPPAPVIAPIDPDAPLPLSAGEEAMLFEYRSDPDGSRYNVFRLYTLRGDVDPDTLVEAIRDVVAHHAPLHTTYDAARTRLSRENALAVTDLGEVDPREMDRVAERQARVPFDLDRGPLVRLHVARTGPDEVRALIGMHHIVIDAGTFDTLWEQVAVRASGGELPALAPTYAEHGRAQAAAHASDPTSRDFWAGRAEERVGFDGIRLAAPEPAEADGYIERLADLTTAELVALPPTPFSAALAAVGAVLSAFAGSADVEIGITASTKDRPDLAPVVGYHLNTLATSLTVDPRAAYRDLVAAASAEVADVLSHRTYPFADVVRDARRAGQVPPDAAIMLDYERVEPPTYPGATVEWRIAPSRTSISDLTFFVQERGDRLHLALEYRGSVVGEADAVRLLDAFHSVLRDGARGPSRPVGELVEPLRSTDLVGPPLPDPAPTVLHRIVASAAERPDAVAVVDGHGASLTYHELAGAVVALADRITHDGGVARGARVGVSVARSCELVVAILGCQAAGTAYVALDPTLPAARTALIAAAAGVDLLVTDDPTRRHDLTDTETLHVTDPAPPGPDAVEALRRRIEDVSPVDPAYVIFTSGSTGTPRGVAVSHANLATSVAARDHWFDAPPTRFLMTSSPGFDSSIVGLFWPLATGGTVVLPSDAETGDIDRLAAAIADRGVTHTLMVPSLARALLDRAADRLGGLDVSIVAGEACPPSLVDRHFTALRTVALVNEYGPTETTVWATAERLTPGVDPVPIGGPIPGTTVRVADGHLRPVPAGVAGELLISGPGVTAGYLDDDTATAERFVTADDRRWYRTGDLARDVGGTLVFLGRTDDQLSVGGVRVEPAEIERELDALPAVAESVVVVAGDPATLVAHVVPAGTGPVDEADLRRRLAGRLPAAIVPRRLVAQPALPRTPHGKLDRGAAHALPLPEMRRRPASVAAGDLVATVVAVWQTVFPGDTVTLDTDFFDAGGDSLTAVEIVSDLGDRLGRTVAIGTLLSGRTPRGMVELLTPDAAPDTAIRPVHFRPGRAGGPLVLMTPTWDDVFGYQALAEAFPADVEVVALRYDPDTGAPPVNRVPEMVAAMQEVARPMLTPGRPTVILGWSIGGVSAIELAAQLRREGAEITATALVDTFHPGEEKHLWSNRWWKYKSLLRRGAGAELRTELRTFLRRRSPRRLVERIGLRLVDWARADDPAPPTSAGRPAPPPMTGSFPAEAFGHRPTAPGVPVVLYRASTTNPARTIRRWREVTTEIVDVVVPGRHRGFDSIMHAPKVTRIAEDLDARIRGRLPLSPER